MKFELFYFFDDVSQRLVMLTGRNFFFQNFSLTILRNVNKFGNLSMFILAAVYDNIVLRVKMTPQVQ